MRTSILPLLILLAALQSPMGWAATVTSTADSGPGSLRDAIAAAAAGETINFTVSGLIALTSEELFIDKSLTLIGPGATHLTIQRSLTAGTPEFRILHIKSGAVRISGLTISNGRAPSGGGIENEDALTLEQCNITDNSATEAGGGIHNSATLALNGAKVSGNSVSGAASAFGGGIDNTGTVTMDECVLSGNSAVGGAADGSGSGGAINSSGTMTISHSLIISNSASGGSAGAGSGGGINNIRGGTVKLTNSIVSNNSAAGGPAGGESSGGGINNEGTVEMVDSTTSGNAATGGPSTGGPGGASQGGGIANDDGTVIVINSTLSDNSARGGLGMGGLGGAGQGGGISSKCGTVTLENSTVSGNAAGAGSGIGGSAAGGGLFNECGTATLNHSTITDNVAGWGALQAGSGVFNTLGGTELKNTIVAGNGAGIDFFNEPSGTIDSGGFNLIGSTNAPFSPGPQDRFEITAEELKLGPLQDNGGPTFTHALLCGSPAIDSGDNTNAPETDQRGFPRIVHGRIDIGAYEDSHTAPSVTCPKSLTLEASSATGVEATLAVQVAGADADELVVVWFVDDAAFQTNRVAVGSPSTGATVSMTASLKPGAHSVLVRVIDTKDCEAMCSTMVLVRAAPGRGCDLYPIALHQESLTGVPVGELIRDIYNGVQPGNFGWLTWAGSPSEPTLAASLTPPGNSRTYVNPNDPNDHLVSVGDWVQGGPGISNSRNVRDALDALKQIDITVPVWDRVGGTGNNSLYRVVAFARVRLVSYQLPRNNRITARFLGFVDCE